MKETMNSRKVSIVVTRDTPLAPTPYSRVKQILFSGLVFLFFCTGAVGDTSDAVIENTRQTLGKWVETERLLSKEKQDLALSKEMLRERIELVHREINTLKEKINETRESIAQTDEKRQGLLEENEKLKSDSASLVNILITLERRVKNLLVRLPKPLQDRVKPLSQRLPEKPEENKQSISERFQNVVGILNEVDKFNRDISVTSEVLTLADGTAAEVTVLYLGISQAYYTGGHGSIGGIGIPSDAGWTWKPANEAAPRIRQAIAILKNEEVASFVQLPVEIQ